MSVEASSSNKSRPDACRSIVIDRQAVRDSLLAAAVSVLPSRAGGCRRQT